MRVLTTEAASDPAAIREAAHSAIGTPISIDALPDGKNLIENSLCDKWLSHLMAPVLSAFWAVGAFGALP